MPPSTTTSSPSSIAALRRATWAISLSNAGFYIAVIPPLQLLLALRLTTVAGEADASGAFGIVTGTGILAAMIASPVAGRLSDRSRARWGRRRMFILIGSLSGAATLLAIAFTNEVWQIMLLWCAGQVLLNLQHVATTAVIADQIPVERRGAVSGLLGLTTALGPIIGIAMVAGLPSDSILQWAVVTAFAVIVSVIAALVLHDRSPRTRSSALRLRDLLASLWINPRRHPAFGWAWLTRFLLTGCFASTTYNTFLLRQEYGIADDEIGGRILLLSFIGVCALALAGMVFGIVSDRMGRQKPFIVLSAVLIAAGLVVFAMRPSWPVLLAAMALLGIGNGIFFAVDMAMCTRVLPYAEDAGKDLAIVNLANSLPQSVVPFLAPVLLSLGGFPALYLFLAAVGLVAILTVRPVPEIGEEHSGRPGIAPITR